MIQPECNIEISRNTLCPGVRDTSFAYQKSAGAGILFMKSKVLPETKSEADPEAKDGWLPHCIVGWNMCLRTSYLWERMTTNWQWKKRKIPSSKGQCILIEHVGSWETWCTCFEAILFQAGSTDDSDFLTEMKGYIFRDCSTYSIFLCIDQHVMENAFCINVQEDYTKFKYNR